MKDISFFFTHPVQCVSIEFNDPHAHGNYMPLLLISSVYKTLFLLIINSKHSELQFKTTACR